MIIENLLPLEKQDELERIMLSEVFPWYFNQFTVNDNPDSGFQFVHRIFDDGAVISDLFSKMPPIMDNFQEQSGLTIKEIVRIKANLLTPATLSESEIQNSFHRDIESKTDDSFVSLVYYVTNSDGNTVISGLDPVSPIKGRACYFNSLLLHRASNPVNFKQRIILNFVFRVK
jgi:hypothetical protein